MLKGKKRSFPLENISAVLTMTRVTSLFRFWRLLILSLAGIGRQARRAGSGGWGPRMRAMSDGGRVVYIGSLDNHNILKRNVQY